MSIPPLSSSNSSNSIDTEETPHVFGVFPGSPTPANHPKKMEIKEKTLPIEITPMNIPDRSPIQSPKAEESSKERLRKYYFLGGALALVGISLICKKFFKASPTPQPKIKKITIPIESIKITSQNKA